MKCFLLNERIPVGSEFLGHFKQTIGWLQLIKSIAKRGPDKNLSGSGRTLEDMGKLAHFGPQGASLGF
jgi:hypothetical protein